MSVYRRAFNIRLINFEQAQALATIEYRDTKFRERKIYTAWDMIGNERLFFEGVRMLEKAGIPPYHLRVYMLCGFKHWSWDDVWRRFKLMTEAGIEPFTMVYDKRRTDLVAFQRWCNRGLYRVSGCSWPEYRRTTRSEESTLAWKRVYGLS